MRGHATAAPAGPASAFTPRNGAVGTMLAAGLTAATIIADLPMQAIAATGGITLALACATLTRSASDIQATDRLLSIASHPETDTGLDPLWLAQFTDMTSIYARTETAVRDDLEGLHSTAWSSAHQKATAHALRVLAAARARKTACGAALDELGRQSEPAAMAALAVIVREHLPVDHFQLMTAPWLAAGLPIPGGDVAAWFTIRIEVLHPEKGWVPVQTEAVEVLSGETPQGLLDGTADRLAATKLRDVGQWRLLLWPGDQPDTRQAPLAQTIRSCEPAEVAA